MMWYINQSADKTVIAEITNKQLFLKKKIPIDQTAKAEKRMCDHTELLLKEEQLFPVIIGA